MLVSRHSVVRIIPVSQVLRYSAIWRNWARIPQIMCRDTWNLIRSLQLLVSHQMRPYSSVRALCGLSYTCFSGTQILRHFRESGPRYSKSRAGTHEKESKIFRSLCYIKWDLTLLSKPSVGWVISVSQVLGFWGNLGKVGLNTPNHAQIHMKINPKSSASHEISFFL